MRFADVQDLIRRAGPLLRDGPLALIVVEEPVDVLDTVQHHLNLGFQRAVIFAEPGARLDQGPAWRVDAATRAPEALATCVSPVLSAAPGAWIYWGYQGEFLTYPFADSRDVRDLLAFHTEERRAAMAGVVIDLYGPPNAECFDRMGYVARDGDADRAPAIYGGLRRRYAQTVPEDRRRIDRVPLIRGATGLRMDAAGRLSDPERMTRACPWHANLTCAVLSRRTARALRRHPCAARETNEFAWDGSVTWQGTARQIVDLGLMEPGQWF